MLKRIYIHNYKAFQNFELKFDNFGSALCLGRNGSGKSSLVEVFNLFQKIGEGTSKISELLDKQSFNILQPNTPIRFELEVDLFGDIVQYELVIDYDKVLDSCQSIIEKLTINNSTFLIRDGGYVLYNTNNIFDQNTELFLDGSLLALSAFSFKTQGVNHIQKFKDWLAHIVVLSPVPALMGQNTNETLEKKPNYFVNNINTWITQLFSEKPRSYQYIDEYLKPIFPDLEEINNAGRQLKFVFKHHEQKKELTFSQLSYGERIFVLWSAILASVKLEQISLCVWDEPENYISLVEIQHYFNSLKQAFHKTALFIATTHNPETMRMFATEDIFILSRKHHLEPIRMQWVSELDVQHDIVDMIKAGLIEL